jgi:hypothetical protein
MATDRQPCNSTARAVRARLRRERPPPPSDTGGGRPTSSYRHGCPGRHHRSTGASRREPTPGRGSSVARHRRAREGLHPPLCRHREPTTTIPTRRPRRHPFRFRPVSDQVAHSAPGSPVGSCASNAATPGSNPTAPPTAPCNRCGLAVGSLACSPPLPASSAPAAAPSPERHQHVSVHFHIPAGTTWHLHEGRGKRR